MDSALPLRSYLVEVALCVGLLALRINDQIAGLLPQTESSLRWNQHLERFCEVPPRFDQLNDVQLFLELLSSLIKCFLSPTHFAEEETIGDPGKAVAFEVRA